MTASASSNTVRLPRKSSATNNSTSTILTTRKTTMTISRSPELKILPRGLKRETLRRSSENIRSSLRPKLPNTMAINSLGTQAVILLTEWSGIYRNRTTNICGMPLWGPPACSLNRRSPKISLTPSPNSTGRTQEGSTLTNSNRKKEEFLFGRGSSLPCSSTGLCTKVCFTLLI